MTFGSVSKTPLYTLIRTGFGVGRGSSGLFFPTVSLSFHPPHPTLLLHRLPCVLPSSRTSFVGWETVEGLSRNEIPPGTPLLSSRPSGSSPVDVRPGPTRAPVADGRPPTGPKTSLPHHEKRREISQPLLARAGYLCRSGLKEGGPFKKGHEPFVWTDLKSRVPGPRVSKDGSPTRDPLYVANRFRFLRLQFLVVALCVPFVV